MVLQAELRDTEIVAFEAGEAQGRAAGLVEGEAKGREAGLAEGEAKERLSNVKAIMDSLKVSALEAMNILKFSPEEQQKLLPLL